MTKEKDDTPMQKYRECVIILLYPTKGNNMSIFNDPDFYYNDLNPDEYEKMLEISSQNNQSFD